MGNNNNYSVNIPSSGATANPFNPPNVAPAVAAGTAHRLDDVMSAHLESQSRKRRKKIDPASVTNDEMAQSLVREAAVTAELAVGTYGGGFATAAQVNALGDRVNALGDRMTALFRSDRVRRYNAKILDNNQLLAQLYKEVAGVGQPLPDRAMAEVPAAPVGTVYPISFGGGGFAPKNVDELNAMALDQISALSQWANDDFGIVNGDNVAQQRNKLRCHYQN